MIFIDFFKAFKQGAELKNSATWKDRQKLANIFCLILTCAVAAGKFFGVEMNFTDDQIIEVGGLIASIMYAGNSILTIVTTSKIGIK